MTSTAITALAGQVSDLFSYVQERCLWQFYSRTKDRTENIEGVLAQVARLLMGQEPKRDTPVDSLQAADAKIMVKDCKERFAWLQEDIPENEVREIIRELGEKLTDIAISRSQNRELNHTLY